MIRPSMDDLPRFDTPDGFRIRNYRDGDADEWVRIHELADLYNKVTQETFEREFGYDMPAMRDRGFFMEAPNGEVIGTATAWYSSAGPGVEIQGQLNYGRVHWVALVPQYQGRGLSKPLLSRVMSRLAESHDKSYLVTSSARLPAIHLYLKYGFRPFLHSLESIEAWEFVSIQLKHPLLEKTYWEPAARR